MKLFNVTRERAVERTRRANAGRHLRTILHQRISDAWLQRADDAAALVSMHANLTELLRVQADIDMSRHRTMPYRRSHPSSTTPPPASRRSALHHLLRSGVVV
jgi:hypothetical protein